MIKLKEIYDKIIEQIEPSKYTLYCDMDGVLCDFEKRFKETPQKTSATGRSDPKSLEQEGEIVEKEKVIIIVTAHTHQIKRTRKSS